MAKIWPKMDEILKNLRNFFFNYPCQNDQLDEVDQGRPTIISSDQYFSSYGLGNSQNFTTNGQNLAKKGRNFEKFTKIFFFNYRCQNDQLDEVDQGRPATNSSDQYFSSYGLENS